MTRLTTTQQVMFLDLKTNASVKTARFTDMKREPGSVRKINLDWDVWQEMGRPYVLTVTVECGDREAK